ncbi:MAG: hypothetical protein KY395_03540 [Actinobacteria bacterium]|nr:hypothetical protein [Actinomycetota bacterium]
MKPGQIVGLVGGLWLMVAPAVFGYVDTPAEDLHRTVGPIVATFAAIALWAATRDVRWVNLPLMATVAVAPLFGGHPIAATLVAVATAAVVAAATPFGGPDTQRRGRGWWGVIRSV